MLADISHKQCIAIFDSGIGGLTILQSLLDHMPGYSFVYFADSLYFPYGSKESRFVIERTSQVIEYLNTHYSVGVYVLACNTATTDAIFNLRLKFTKTPFLGTEPAVLVAKKITKNGKIGVIATKGTVSTKRYNHLVHLCSLDKRCRVYSRACPGLAMMIQKVTPHYEESIYLLLKQNLMPLIEEGIDVLVLGCTHYSLIKKEIQNFVGPHITVIDSPDAIARNCAHIIKENNISIALDHNISFLSSDRIIIPSHIISLYPSLNLSFVECPLPRLSLSL